MTRAVLLVLLAAGAGAEDGARLEPLEFRLRSGTRLVGALATPGVRIDTEFGRLAIPAAEVVSVRFGRRSDPERLAAVRAHVDRLGAADPDARRAAAERLAAGGAFAAGELAAAVVGHEVPEVRRACRNILDALDLREEDLVPLDDAVHTRRFTAVGEVREREFRLAVPELGELRVLRRDLVGIAPPRAPEPQEPPEPIVPEPSMPAVFFDGCGWLGGG